MADFIKRFLLALAVILTASGAPADDLALAAAHSRLPSRAKLGKNDALLLVLVNEQRMIACFGMKKTKSYRVSTAAAGVGAQANSGKTPPGWHKVHSRFGAKACVGQVFKSRRIVPGHVLTPKDWYDGEGDVISSRILWLEGLEDGVNKSKDGKIDSFLRYIYIHGTNQERRLGTKASHGCIRMGNNDIVELFEALKAYKNVYVYISN